MSATTNTTKLFLYGTVKRGQPNHHAVEAAPGKSTFIGKAVTKDKYPLIICTKFNIPMLLGKCGVGKHVHGEVFEINDERESFLDKAEDYPRTYNKKRIMVTMEESGQEVECLCYVVTNYPEHLEKKTHYADYDSYGDHGKLINIKALTEAYDDSKVLYDYMMEDM